ncbi:peroxin 14 [Lasius niger]|uniref:Peroxin 14 n=1 Tax=Lasius niger TaxID=67767 RepID=A0A0J7KSF6_LASNI|nr:peroxin 14 [Lasius niger]
MKELVPEELLKWVAKATTEVELVAGESRSLMGEPVNKFRMATRRVHAAALELAKRAVATGENWHVRENARLREQVIGLKKDVEALRAEEASLRGKAAFHSGPGNPK